VTGFPEFPNTQVLKMNLSMLKLFQMMSSKNRRLPLILFLLLMLRVMPPKPPPLKTELLLNLLKTWRGLCKEVMILYIENLPLVETREELPEGQDPSPSVVAFNESFSMSFRGELLSVSCETDVADGGAPKLSLLWKSPKFMDDTGGDSPMKTLQLSSKAVCDLEKQPSSSLKKSSAISDRATQAPLETLDRKGLHTIFFFHISLLLVSYIFLSFLVSYM
jgi:hypothetical protein